MSKPKTDFRPRVHQVDGKLVTWILRDDESDSFRQAYRKLMFEKAGLKVSVR